MKRLILPLLTALAMATLNPSTVSAKEKIQVAFVLDITGSMSAMIETAKDKIWSIANGMSQSEDAEIEFGLIGYRDKTDSQMIVFFDLTRDMDMIYTELMNFQALGGGDRPEHVNLALHKSVHEMSWDKSEDVMKTVFLVGDSPPHMDYTDDVKYNVTCKKAAKKGIVINTIQMGSHHDTQRIWKEIADCSNGSYIQVNNSGNNLAISTPFDDDISKKSAELEDTKIYYGDRTVRAEQNKRKDKAKAMVETAEADDVSRRAAYNLSSAGASNFYGSNELIKDLEDGKIQLESIDEDHLPDEMKDMTESERAAYVAEQKSKRKELMSEIAELSKKRDAYIEDKLSVEEKENSFSKKIHGAMSRQAETEGRSYGGEVKY